MSWSPTVGLMMDQLSFHEALLVIGFTHVPVDHTQSSALAHSFEKTDVKEE